MALIERIYDILIISASSKFNDALLPFVKSSRYGEVRIVSDLSLAKRALAERAYDFVIINAPLPGGMGTRFASDLCRTSNASVLMMTASDLYADIFDKVFSFGVYTLPKPVSRQLLTEALDWMASGRERLRLTEKRTLSIEEKMEEIRLVNRAKWHLIRERHMEEPAAHRFIEKEAMDRCISKREVAEEILHGESPV